MEIEVDDNGWAAIHHCVAAEKELLMSIEKIVTTNPDNLEIETKDEHRRTPLLLAVHCNKRKSVEKLLDLGALIEAKDGNNFGVIETCVMDENVNMLHYFIDLQDENVNVWKILIKFMSEEAEMTTLMIERLTSPHHETETQCSGPHWEQLMQVGGIPLLIKTCRSGGSTQAVKINGANILKNIICRGTIIDAVTKAHGIEMLLDLVKSNIRKAMDSGFFCLQEIAKSSMEYAQKIQMCGFLKDTVKLFHQPSHLSTEVLTNAIIVLEQIALISDEARTTIGTTPSLIENLTAMYDVPEYLTCFPLLIALTGALDSIVSGNEENQNRCIDAGVATHLIMVSRVNKSKELQMAAIKALYSLTLNNQYASKHVVDEGAVTPLMQIVKRSRAINLQEVIARTLWALTGPNIDKRRTMASMIGVNLLIEFLSAQGDTSDNLNYIGCEGLSVLARGAINKQDVINEANGITPLCRLLRSSSPTVVTAALQALRYLCLNIGYMPNVENQNAISQSHGMKVLIALMAHSKSEQIQVESAFTIAAAVLGNKANIATLHESPDFTYLHVIRLLYSDNDLVRLTAGTALATFSFNTVSQQQQIAECGGVCWQNFTQFLEEKNQYFVVNVAFQVVVMSHIIPDEEPAISSAEGIRKLVEVLENCEDENIAALASDCVARLAHTRAGVPAAMVAINVIPHLCKLLKSQSEQVRGSAAVAIGYLSFDHTAERQLLNICRLEPQLIHVIKFYTKNFKLSPAFLEGWKHCLHVGLHTGSSSASEMMQTLTQNLSSTFLKAPKELNTALISLADDAATARSNNYQMSRSSQFLATPLDGESQINDRASHSTMRRASPTIDLGSRH